ncbi:RNA polymerase III subunit RPC82 helix-turn-helix domain-containing protein [Gaertneriomyces semiglobifer]|nr:RNA polymerase III subunit RPC82 helix-turn-helix domain-containing protein [Gaertneriomyces semiglobifer]
MSSLEIRLCRRIVEQHFGPIVERVCTVILRKGRSTLPLICRASEISPKKVRESLFVLIQHGIVTYFDTEEKNRIVTYYEAHVHKITVRDCFPLFIHTVRAQLGLQCETVYREVLRHGLLNLATLLGNKELGLSGDQLREAWSQLQEAKVIRICREEDTKTLEDVQMKELDDEINRQGGLPLTAAEKTKIKRGLNAKRDAMYDESAMTGSKRKVVKDFDEVANKMSRVDGDSEQSHSGDVDFYCASYERPQIYLKNDALAMFMERRVNKAAGDIMRNLLQLGTRSSRSCKDESSEPVSQITLASQLSKEVEAVVEGKAQHGLGDYLELLAHDEIGVVKKDSAGGGGQYSVAFAKAGDVLRARVIESVIQERLGDGARRVWRILYHKSKLTDAQVAKFALIPSKNARGHLFELLKIGLAFIQDVPKTADHSAARTYFLWYVSIPKSASVLVQDAYKTLCNIKERRLVEANARSILIEKTRRLDVISGESQLSEGELSRVAQWQKIVAQMNVCETRIAHFLMVFKDF